MELFSIADALRFVTPSPMRRLLRLKHRDYVFSSALKALLQDTQAATDPASALVHDLIYGWGNQGWTPSAEYLSACIEYAIKTDGAVLECGSGLTTILLGLVTKRHQRPVWTLEHRPEWAQRVSRHLSRHGLSSVHLCTQPLRNFVDFVWYDPPLHDMPDFSLVICDGPPADTPGGRMGLLPVMKNKLRPSAVILLDDAGRQQEIATADEWARELNTNYQLVGSDRPYIVMITPPSPLR